MDTEDTAIPKDRVIPEDRVMLGNENYFAKRASIVESGEEEKKLNDYLIDNFHNDEFYPLHNNFRILKIKEKAKAEDFFLKTLPAGNPRHPIIKAYVDQEVQEVQEDQGRKDQEVQEVQEVQEDQGRKDKEEKVRQYYLHQSQITRRKEQLSEYLQDKQAVVQSIHLNISGYRDSNDGGDVGYAKYVNGKIRDAFLKSKINLLTDKTYYLLVIYFKNGGNFYVALSLSVAVTDPKTRNIISATNHNEFIGEIGENTEKAIHEVYRLIIDYDYNAKVTDLVYYDGKAAAPNFSKNFIGYHVDSQVTTRILDPKPPNSHVKLYNAAVKYAREKEADAREKEADAKEKAMRLRSLKNLPQRSSRLTNLPPQIHPLRDGGSIGGKKTSSKKEVLGKMRCIYKIPGDRKEYVKYKGKLITLKDYKMLNKKPRKVADKKPRKVADKKPRKVADKKAKRPKKRST